MKKQKELRFFLIDMYEVPSEMNDRDLNGLSNKEFMTEAERQGYVYSLREFQYQFNATDSISTNKFMRVIPV